MVKKKILIFKNDRTGDLFVSLNAINSILNKHKNDEIKIFLSNINQKFNFLFPLIKTKIFSMNLNFFDKIWIFIYFFRNNIDSAYILTPKMTYFILPFIFRKTKFYGITIKGKRNRPPKFLLSYLHKYVIIDRQNIKKRNSSYVIQLKLIDYNLINQKNLINTNSRLSHNFTYPKKYIFFHYKKRLFEDLLNWKLKDVENFLNFLSTKYENIIFSSEIKNENLNNYFSNISNTYNFVAKSFNKLNNKNIFFLKDIDGFDLFDAIKKSYKIVAPEGIITHIGYFLKRPILALMHFDLKNKDDFRSQLISCKEWFPPNNYNFIVLKKDYSKSIQKLSKRL